MARSRIVRTPDQVASILADFDASELTVAAYCRETGLSSSTLRLWLRKRDADAGHHRSAPPFQRVEIVPSPGPLPSSLSAALELAFPCGVTLRIHGHADSAQLELAIASVFACTD